MANARSNIALFLLSAIVLMVIIWFLQFYESSPPVTGSTYPQTNTSNCQYGHICGIASYGCAIPGAIYNCPAKIVGITNNTNLNATVAVMLAEELNNSVNAGFNLNQSMFYSNSQAGCSKELISACNNNSPQQYICINSQYVSAVSGQYPGIYSSPHACPMFYMAGNVSCGIVNNYCVVLDQGSSP
jgi:hypothetical protein